MGVGGKNGVREGGGGRSTDHSFIPIDRSEKDGGCTFYQNALRSEIVF